MAFQTKPGAFAKRTYRKRVAKSTPAKAPKRKPQAKPSMRKPLPRLAPSKPKPVGPSFFDARLAAQGNWSCITGLPTLANYTPINVMRSYPVTTEATPLLIVCNFSYSGVAWWIMQTAGLDKGKVVAYMHEDLQADAPMSLRGSRKTISLQNVTQENKLQALVKVSVTSAPLPLESTDAESMTTETVDELVSLCESSNKARNFSAASFVSGMAFHCGLASVIQAAEWQTYDAANPLNLASKLGTDAGVAASSSILILLPSTNENHQTFNIQVNSQIACRYKATHLLSSNTKDGTIGFGHAHKPANQAIATTVVPSG